MKNFVTNNLTSLWQWVDKRLPVQKAWDTHMAKYYAPKNFNFWYYFGVLSLIVLVIQLLSGIWLLMFYNTSGADAFSSIEYIMRDVPWGSYIRYMHSTGASAFFIVVYLHMFRALLYGSYKAPRELLWILGMLIYVALMAEGFLGYVLPWGQMSYWGAQVIINLVGALPFGIGEPVMDWIRSDFLISGATLNKFVSLHAVALPLVLIILVFMHILALHEVGSNNPDGIEIKETKDEKGIPKDGIPFFPYYLPLHDLMPICIFLFAFCSIMFFFPEMGGYFLEYANFEPANQYKTPEHIAPVWYFTPFYSILRAVNFDILGMSAKLLGFAAMVSAIAILFVLPWIDKSPVKSIRYKGKLTISLLLIFAASFVVLGILGVKAPSPSRVLLAQITTLMYFGYFVCMPVWSNPRPASIVGKGLCYFYALCFLVLTVFDLSSMQFYGSKTAMGSSLTHPSIILLIISLLLAVLFALLPKLATREAYTTPPTRVTMQGLGFKAFFKGLFVVAILTLIPILAVGAESKYACGSIPCEQPKFDLSNKESLQNGFKWYSNYCAGCHSLKYVRYERIANDIGIPVAIMTELLPQNKKIGDRMQIAMSEKEGKKWFGAAPPDLSLVARSRNPQWLYTYLKNFYKDDSRPFGVNNRVFENVGMPHAMLELQGVPECKLGAVLAANGGLKRDPITRELILEQPCGVIEVSADNKGILSAAEFDRAVYDISNFLEYVADPGKLARHRIGVYVLLFISILFAFSWALNKEYWKDIH